MLYRICLWVLFTTGTGFTAMAQPAFNPTAKGNKQKSLQVMLAPTDLFWTETTLSLQKNSKTYGLHLAPAVSWFVENGWSIGIQGNLGFYRSKQQGSSNWNYDEKSFELALVPFTRYYFTIDKKHRFKPFLFAGLPLIYSDNKRSYNNSSITDFKEQTLTLDGSFGFGAAYFGKAGSLELNVSNMGLFIGISKFLR